MRLETQKKRLRRLQDVQSVWQRMQMSEHAVAQPTASTAHLILCFVALGAVTDHCAMYLQPQHRVCHQASEEAFQRPQGSDSGLELLLARGQSFELTVYSDRRIGNYDQLHVLQGRKIPEHEVRPVRLIST